MSLNISEKMLMMMLIMIICLDYLFGLNFKMNCSSTWCAWQSAEWLHLLRKAHQPQNGSPDETQEELKIK